MKKKTYIAEFIKDGRVVQRLYSPKRIKGSTYEEVEKFTGRVVETYHRAKGNNPYVARFYAESMIPARFI